MTGDIPRATYRLQLHRGFGFDAAAAHVPYLARLGISHVYASPVLTARAGSMHGYDVVDHASVNPELGGEDGLRRLVAALRAHDMGLVVDIVPNHMAVGADNAWWFDVLEWGRESAHATTFDIDWDVPDPMLAGRVLLPVLGRPYGEALAAAEIALRFDAGRRRLCFAYFDHRFPVSASLYAVLLRTQGDAWAELSRRFRTALASGRRADRRGGFDAACAELARVADQRPDEIDSLLARFTPEGDENRERLHRLLERQHYRLAWWRTAPDEINWRRFFDITDLAGVRIQSGAVFDAVHATVFRLYAEGLVDGLRVDHVDGLADPRAYCRKLRRRLEALAPQRPEGLPRGRAYLVVEKILAPGEKLARDWRVDGTSGYVFMNDAGAVLHDPEGRDALADLWHDIGGRGDFAAEEERARRRIPQELFAADFAACAHALHAIARSDLATRDWSLAAIRRVLGELLAHFPVYRTYVDARGRSRADAAIMAKVVEAATRTCRPGETALVALVDRWLGGEAIRTVRAPVQRRLRERALARFQQLTSPVAAKSVEDTAFYRFGVLVSRNEVGANPGLFAMTPAEFHAGCAERARRYPHAMLATATHDHKRGEDVRARLAVLSEMPAPWAEAVQRWRTHNAPAKDRAGGVLAPDAIDEYVLYQMLVGAWPMDLAADDAQGLEAFGERLCAWLEKAVREAKRRSGWVEPNIAYERGCQDFLARLLDPWRSAEFLAQVRAFVDRIAPAGAVNGLVQALLRVTSPGVPDTYQGTECWDLSLVDPDNRRPVDFEIRAAALEDGVHDAVLLDAWRDGRVKQRLVARALAYRAVQAGVFRDGDYVPLKTRGAAAPNLVAFARVTPDAAAIVVVPRCASRRLSPGGSLDWQPGAWSGTRIELPQALAERSWTSVLSPGAPRTFGAAPRAEVFLSDGWPVALYAG